jgi:tripartite-type tricarboxylate transporter receptor subunit TctC
MVIPAGPGGSTDLIMRGVAQYAAKLLGQPIVIVNRAGASGMIGVASVAHAKPDGYTLGGVWNGPITMAPQVGPPHYTPTDYTVVSMTSSASGVLCVPPSFPANNGREFLDELRSHPNKYTYGADGVGGFVQFATEHIFNEAGIKQQMIPYSGTGQTVTAFLGGIVNIYGGAIAPILPFVRQGKAKCLLVTSAKRFAVLPKVDSLSDVGLAPAQTVLWHGVIAPAGVPADVMAKLEDAFQKAAQDPRFKSFAEAQGEEPWIIDSAEATRYARDEFKAMGELAQKIQMRKTQ